MGKVIHLQNGTKIRTQAMKMLSYLIRYLASTEVENRELDEILLYMGEQLEIIQVSVDQSATAWEKRDYWLKADQFRRQWEWTEKIKSDLSLSLQHRSRTELPQILANLAGRLGAIEAPKRMADSRPWKKNPSV